MAMTSTTPNLDRLFVKMEDQDGVLDMPLCEVIEGTYHKDGDRHIVTIGDDVADFTQGKFSKFLDVQFSYLGKVQYWLIQAAGEERSPTLKIFLETFNK